MTSTRGGIAALVAAFVGAGALIGCSAQTPAGPTDAPSGSPGGTATAAEQVTLRVVSLLPGSEQAAIDAFNAQVAEFEAANPGIDIVPEEYEWKATTFAAQLAGGTLPHVFEIPFTDGKTLIENKQIAELDAQFQTLPYASKFNESLLAAGKGPDGKVYAIPAKNVYGVGLHINRDLFTSAGLDPDKPPTTWTEVREAARKIAEANPGVAGYMQMTQNNTGGWQLVANTFAHGGRVQTLNADGTATSTLDNEGTKAALQMLKDMRWADNSMGSNFMFDWGSINQAFAAGQVGMFTSGSDVYTSMVQTNGLNPEMYGLGAMPQEGEDAGVLTGGTLVAMPASATDAEKDAAIKWIDFFYLAKLIDKDRAIADAKTLVANNQPVGTPVLPMFNRAQYEENQSWIKEFINLPLDQMKGYTSTMFDLNLVGEPSQKTQEIYALLDPVVQAVLTDKDADIDKLLADVNKQAQALLDAK
ncbi:ABC transporter substrate-binding protein [Tessaracoccus defluvii]|uniref:Extracellular solute-binding protein n=1 Tax=Tessaracoccus defluvii TaxID=1285901 RepID=A0A7H0H6U1_9ACTN|nr:extracellular solute-binding protein [Tessaracoccus defluvii]QNP56257.1 extracellular solute-binding protein [Tessaracoccus defluvii]